MCLRGGGVFTGGGLFSNKSLTSFYTRLYSAYFSEKFPASTFRVTEFCFFPVFSRYVHCQDYWIWFRWIHPELGNSKLLRNAGIKLLKYTAWEHTLSCDYCWGVKTRQSDVFVPLKAEQKIQSCNLRHTRVGTLIVATIYLQLIQNRYMFRSFTVLQCSHQHCVQPVASDVVVVGYL